MICKDCGEDKPITDFNKFANRKTRKLYTRKNCKKCEYKKQIESTKRLKELRSQGLVEPARMRTRYETIKWIESLQLSDKDRESIRRLLVRWKYHLLELPDYFEISSLYIEYNPIKTDRMDNLEIEQQIKIMIKKLKELYKKGECKI